MRTFVTVVLALALVAGGLVTYQGVRADDKDAAIAEMIKLGTPGAAHKVLEPLVGSWNVKVKMYKKPGEATVSEGTAERKWILDGRFVADKFEGDFGGMKFTGLGLTGYDNQKKKYVGMWVDSMSTALMTVEGTYDADTKTLTQTGKHYCPECKAIVEMRDVTRIVDNDTIEQKMYRTPPGQKETLGMEITYTRKAK